MFSLKTTSLSTESILSMYGTFAASAMLVRTVISDLQAMISQLVPENLRHILLSKFGCALWGNPFRMTLLIDEFDGLTTNELFEASEIYLSTKVIASSANSLKVFKAPGDKGLSLKINENENITDMFDEIQLNWKILTFKESNEATGISGKDEKSVIELSFHKKYTDKVVNSYLPYVMERSNAIKQEKEVVKLYSLEGLWESTNLAHPATFDTLAMDPTLKKELIDDLDRFVRRKDFYRKVGKAWKRGYLLYGPPGTGKSSLIAAMANYLNFSIFDLELSSVYSNSDLRRVLVSTRNRSILVIEDIDCSTKFQDRSEDVGEGKLTLSGLLNFIDGLWSSCGDERIIVFTTNYKDKLDPALLRPGRMDMHIHMSYCTPSGFRILASNYLGIDSHNSFTEIDKLLMEVEVTPAEVAEELMRSELDADVALSELMKLLQEKRSGSGKFDSDDGETDENEV